MKKKMFALLCACAVTVGLLAGCGGSASSTSAPASGGETAKPAETQTSTSETEGVQASPEFYAKADLSTLSGKKIGVTIQSLQNAYWAGVMTALQNVVEENGGQITIVACDDSSATQIGQIENFVSSKCDLIMIHPSDAAAVEDAAAQAREAGIKVMCWDDPMTNTDGNWVLNNTDLGIEIGKAAGEFISEHYTADNKAQIAMI
ncbi:MAG: substrate-binding domain-containing protein, partial [Lachnospiraceae bacterium]|nr:substrate-binding domain-containing protein [Lachnospiraceae bacterium]